MNDAIVRRYMKHIHLVSGALLVIALLSCVGAVAGLSNNSAGLTGTGDISDDIAAYSGPIGADNPMHGLKLAMEDLDETFTFNDTQRVEKRLDHAQLRIAEVRQELDFNRTAAADRVLEQYRQKLNLTEGSLAPFESNTTRLLHAQEILVRHEAVLENLLARYPDNRELKRAYNNSLLLEQKFGDKTEMRFTRIMEKNNKTVFKAIRKEVRNQDNSRSDMNTPVNSSVNRDALREKMKDQKDLIPIGKTIQQNGIKNDTLTIQKKTQEDKGSSQNKGKNGNNT
jgi:hypothetical protein